MAIYTQKEFAALVNMPPNRLTIYKNRGKINIINHQVDTADAINAAFLDKYRTRNVPKQEITTTIVPKVVQTKLAVDETLFVPTENQSYSESERQLKYLDTLKRKKEIEKLDIDIAKKRGEVIPTELMSPLVLQHNQSITTEYKYVIDEFIRIFSAKYRLNVNEIAEITGKMTQSLNKSVDKATETTINSIESIVNEYAEKRGVGERN
jgi:hypothetical protein